MSDPSNERHPSTMSVDETQALRDSDPSAFDDDDVPAKGGEATDDVGDPSAAVVTDPPAAKAGGEPAATDSAGGEPDAGAEKGGGTKPPDAVPKARLDEVIGQRNQAEQLARQQAAELATLRAQLAATEAPKDYEAEYDEAQRKYDEGELDTAEFAREQRRIQREEFDAISKRNALETRQETVEQAVKKSWDEEVHAFAAANPGFLGDAKNDEVFQRALNSTFAFYGDSISQSEMLRKASEQAFAFVGYTPPAVVDAAAAPAAAAEAVAGRRQQNAQRAAEASAAPPQINGGVGERGGPSRGVDLDHLKPGTFSKNLSVAEQEKLLGEGGV